MINQPTTRSRSSASSSSLGRLLIQFLCVFVSLQVSSAKVSASLPIDLPSDQRYAYVTLLYGDEFALGVRTLGQSLRATRNEKRKNIDHVVLVTASVGEEMQKWLEKDGWIVKRVEEAVNPNNNFAKRLHGVYTKLEIFKLTEYHRVVYLDADTTLLENVDELFLCGPFCAVMRHSELINTGVIVVEPSYALHNDLKTKVGMGLYSYTGGDQGFLNSYYDDYAACPYFEPMKQIGLGSDGSKCRRLPHRYNGDWPIAMLNGKLEMVRTKNSMQKEFGEFRRSRILHYTVGSFKPWDWYSSILFPFTYHWTRAAADLPQTPQDKRQFQEEILWIVLGGAFFLLGGLVVLHGGAKNQTTTIPVSHRQSQGGRGSPVKCIFSFLRLHMTPRNTSRSTASISWSQDPLSRGSLAMHLFAGFLSFAISFGLGFLMVPTHTHNPIMGFSIFLIWGFGFFFSLYSLYAYRWFLQGEAHKTAKSPKTADVDLEQNPLLKMSSKWDRQGGSNTRSSTLQAARTESFTYAAGLVAFVVWFVVLRIHTHTVSFGQVLPPLMALMIVLAVGLTFVFYRLPLLWYQEGLSA